MKMQDNMISKAFKAGFEVFFKFYDNCKTNYEFVIGEKEKTHIFFNAFLAEKCNLFVQQQTWENFGVTQKVNPDIKNKKDKKK